MATYKIKTRRYIRKYTAAEKLPVSAALIDAQRVVDELCNVPWEQAAATTAVITAHDENELDANVANRDRFDAALFCAEHANGAHRAYANAACYKIPFPAGTAGKKLTSLKVRVTSDAYNAGGARIALVTNSTGVIPTACAECRGEGTGGIHAAGVAPQTIQTVGGQRYGYPTIADCIFNATPGEGEYALPTGGLTLGSYLYVFVLMENYNSVRGNWLEGSSCIVNQIEIVTDTAITGWTDGALIDLTGSQGNEFNVCRGGVLPPLLGNVSGVQALDVTFDGQKITEIEGSLEKEGDRSAVDDSAAVGLRTAYGIFYKGGCLQINPEEYGLNDVACPGVAFSVSARRKNGGSIGEGSVVSWMSSSVSSGMWYSVAYGNGVFVAGGSAGQGSTPLPGLWYSTDKGRTWNQSSITSGKWNSLAFGNDVFVAGSDSDDGIYYSTDGGRRWTQSSLDDRDVDAIGYGNGVFVAGSINFSHYSTDGGKNWTTISSDAHFGSFAYGNGVFVAGSSNDGIYYSTDGGRTWTKSSLGDVHIKGVAFGGGVFVAVSYSSITPGIFRSTDNGRTWNRTSLTSGSWYSVSYGGGLFVAGSYASGFWYSKDQGITWERSQNYTNAYGLAVAYGGGVFISCTSLGINYCEPSFSRVCWKIMSSVLFVRTSVPLEFNASRVRLDWSNWSGSATNGAKFNVWLKRGGFAEVYDIDAIKNHIIYDAESDSANGFELVGTIDATSVSRTATFDLKKAIEGEVATFLLSAFVSMDNVNPSGSLSLPVGAASSQYVDTVGKRVVNMTTGWKPDITLLD